MTAGRAERAVLIERVRAKLAEWERSPADDRDHLEIFLAAAALARVLEVLDDSITLAARLVELQCWIANNLRLMATCDPKEVLNRPRDMAAKRKHALERLAELQELLGRQRLALIDSAIEEVNRLPAKDVDEWASGRDPELVAKRGGAKDTSYLRRWRALLIREFHRLLPATLPDLNRYKTIAELLEAACSAEIARLRRNLHNPRWDEIIDAYIAKLREELPTEQIEARIAWVSRLKDPRRTSQADASLEWLRDIVPRPKDVYSAIDAHRRFRESAHEARFGENDDAERRST